MAILKNNYEPQQIEINIKLLNTKGFDYEKDRKDYLNWIPIKFALLVEKETYEFVDTPILSLEGVKKFLSQISNVLNETDKQTEKKETFEYCSTDGEFEINFKNSIDNDNVELSIWINVAYCNGTGQGFYKGFRFWINYDDLRKFESSITSELKALIESSSI